MVHSLFGRLMAAGCAMVVLALVVFAASPQLHAKLHAPHASSDDECAVVLFAGGVAAPALAIDVPPPPSFTDVRPVTADEVDLTTPRHLWCPGRAPPCAG